MIFDTEVLNTRLESVKKLLIGYRALLSSPDTTETERLELNQGLSKNQLASSTFLQVKGLGVLRPQQE